MKDYYITIELHALCDKEKINSIKKVFNKQGMVIEKFVVYNKNTSEYEDFNNV